MDLGIAGKSALVMSSTRGLGFGCATALIAEGAKVLINGRNKERGKKAVKKLGENSHFIQADISKPEERERLFKEAQAHLSLISILVINNESPPGINFLNVSEEDWQAAIDQLLFPALDMVRKCLPEMIESGYGRIVNISSTSTKEIVPGPLLSNSLKPGLLGALGTLAREVGATGVTVNSILPGLFDTDLMKQYALNASEDPEISLKDAMKLFSENKPMKRWGTIEEFGALCAFLCSVQAGYITGQSIVIDGGQVTSLF